MSREFKFRVWEPSIKAMLAPSVVGEFGWYLTDLDFENGKRGSGDLMQFTGLKDVNGKEIYEGDIVRLSAGHPSWIAKPFQVVFLYGAFQFNQPPLKANTAIAVYFNDCLMNLGMENDCDIKALIEVIGNIYENHELLKP